MDNHSDDMDASTKKNNNNQQHSVFNLSSNSSSKDLPPLLASVGNDKSASYISHLLQEADLSALIPMDAFTQIKFFLDERSHLINQVCRENIFSLGRILFFDFSWKSFVLNMINNMDY